MMPTLNPLATWLEQYLAEVLGGQDGFEYAPTGLPDGSGVLVTVGFMPEAPPTIVTISGYDFPDATTPGSLEARVQVRARSPYRQSCLDLADSATRILTKYSSRLDRVKRTNIQPIGQDQMGNHEATSNLIIETTERTD